LRQRARLPVVEAVELVAVLSTKVPAIILCAGQNTVVILVNSFEVICLWRGRETWLIFCQRVLEEKCLCGMWRSAAKSKGADLERQLLRACGWWADCGLKLWTPATGRPIGWIVWSNLILSDR
jgi:hypothetical protein